MIARYILHVLLMVILTLLGFIITPINYFIKGFVRKYNIVPLWWFLNDTVPISPLDIDAGDYGRFDNNFIGFFRQNGWRNSHWNLRLVLGRKLKGVKTDIDGEMTLLSTTWNYKAGTTKATYRIDGKNYFRVSMIKEIWKYYFHCQLGSNDYRYLFKFKTGKIR